MTEKLTGEWIGSAKSRFGIKFKGRNVSVNDDNQIVRSEKNDTIQISFNDINDTAINVCSMNFDTVININNENIEFEFKDRFLFVSNFDNQFEKKYVLEWADIESDRIAYYPEKLRAMNLDNNISHDDWVKNSYGDSIKKYEKEIQIVQINKNYCILIVNNNLLLNLKRK